MLAEFGLLLLLASVCFAQTGGRSVAEIRKVHVIPRDGKVKIEITLTGPVTPVVTVTTKPDRLVLDLPDITTTARQERIAVNRDGVKGVRVGLNNAAPLMTRLVVDLDDAHQYELATSGNTVTLTVLPMAAKIASGKASSGAAPAANGPLVGKLWPSRQHDADEDSGKILRFSSSKDKSGTNAQSTTGGIRTSFKVKYVAEGAAYLN